MKTICAFGNNYYDNDLQYIFLGVDEVNNEESKSTPSLPIIGIGEAKKALQNNGSPNLYHKTFESAYNLTSVVIPVNEEYLQIKNGTNLKNGVEIKY